MGSKNASSVQHSHRNQSFLIFLGLGLGDRSVLGHGQRRGLLVAAARDRRFGRSRHRRHLRRGLPLSCLGKRSIKSLKVEQLMLASVQFHYTLAFDMKRPILFSLISTHSKIDPICRRLHNPMTGSVIVVPLNSNAFRYIYPIRLNMIQPDLPGPIDNTTLDPTEL